MLSAALMYLSFLRKAHPDPARLGECPSLLPLPHTPQFVHLPPGSLEPLPVTFEPQVRLSAWCTRGTQWILV